jgi:hypothetical protein
MDDFKTFFNLWAISVIAHYFKGQALDQRGVKRKKQLYRNILN